MFLVKWPDASVVRDHGVGRVRRVGVRGSDVR
jgi:hypothetical protein